MAVANVAQSTEEKIAAAAPASGGTGGKPPRLPGKEPEQESFRRKRLWVGAPEGTMREDVLHPEFWREVKRWLTRHDVVTVMAFDESWELECRVEKVLQDGADVSISKSYARTPIQQSQNWLGTEHYTEWRGAMAWCVVRANDGFPILTGHTLEGGAIAEFYRTRPKAA